MEKSGETDKSGKGERVLRILRDVHIALGAAALAGAVLFPPFAFLSTVAAYEGANAFVHEALRRAAVRRRNKHGLQALKSAPA